MSAAHRFATVNANCLLSSNCSSQILEKRSSATGAMEATAATFGKHIGRWKMDFRSDNIAGISHAIIDEIILANRGSGSSYSEDDQTREVEDTLRAIFECNLRFFPVLTGTAANALALACLTPPYGGIFCSDQAHVYYDECAAPEFFTGGAKLIGLRGTDGRLEATMLDKTVERALQSGVHHSKPTTVSISQATEVGTVYRPDKIEEISEVCKKFGLRLHMDGARFANALTFLGVTPAELTWKAGVDLLCFGGTKNGAFSAESIVVFDGTLAGDLAYRIKRAGHLASKSRFISAQWAAYLRNDLWLRNSEHANAMAARLSTGLSGRAGVKVVHATEANEVFVEVDACTMSLLERSGVQYGIWSRDQGNVLRFVTSFDTKRIDVDNCLAVFQEAESAAI